ncbi:M23 family metallopeptidase [Trueperella abortisuis]|uniref:Murein DD-endopeptidase MepM/ murein hydrolase activator NlpD n=1 Tax=Trueperella abortisuis TaxID=445930 RepID=A0ABT9PLP2_9ACTO|nr:M23 family metallopeptidase [Trueperella abortisuis]MDP9833055.1 murein DD-endopeptidase MepM/ murein hydrolase activator NlpD [Trueperella abortisuis]
MAERETVRPSRRDLRLAREAQLRDTQATEVIEVSQVVTESASHSGPASSLFDRVIREAKRPAFAGILSAVVAVSAAAGVAFGGLYSASAVQGADTLATSTVATPQPTVPDTLKKTNGAADSARYRGFERSYDGAVIQCGLRGGANSLSAAFEGENNLVVMPMAKGTYRLTSPFGWRIDPISYTSSFHLGQDFAAAKGTPIYAMADGEVIYAGEGIEGRSSNVIVIAHEINGKKYTTWYVHMYDDGVHVKKGDKVKVGQHIADAGSQGWSTGPHLHFEVHEGHELHTETDDNVIDPMKALEDFGAVDLSDIC